MADVTLKRGDTYPAIVTNLMETVDGVQTAIDLSDATTVELLLKGTSGSVTAGGMCTITDAAAGEVSYTLQTADTATARTWNAEYEITWSGGGIETVPNDSYFQILIVDDLG